MYLSYNSLIFLALRLGYSSSEAPAYPFTLDAMVLACYVSQQRLAGLQGFGAKRLYLVVVGAVAAALTGSGNGLHGVIVWHLVGEPLPWPLLALGSMVPAAAMVGAGHAIAIMRSAERSRQETEPEPVPSQRRVSVDEILATAQAEKVTAEDVTKEWVMERWPWMSASTARNKAADAGKKVALNGHVSQEVTK
jgi:hypothetical protein